MSTLFTFPGQGTQKPGMLDALAHSPIVKNVFDQATDILGYSIEQLDTQEALQLNRNVQVAMTVSACASFEWLKSEGIQPNYLLGLSIGAFPAAICSGIMSFEDGLKLVDLRGKLMSEAYPKHYGMAAIIGLTVKQVQAIIEKVSYSHEPIYLANRNTETQNIISGSYSALDYACELAIAQQAMTAKRLNVNTPSHCELLALQSEQLLDAINEVSFFRPKITYVSSSAARVLYDIPKIKEDLATNMARQVRWWETAAMIEQRGVKLAIELSPGSVLTGLCQSSMQNTHCISMDTTRIDNIKALYQRF